jgi:tetratricopeptide (TPR) repeat protein
MKLMFAIPLMILMGGLCLASPRSEVKKGNNAAKTGNAGSALTHYVRALEEKGDSSVVLYDMGNLLYDQGEYQKATQSFAGALDPKASKAEQAETLYNLGNAFFQAQQFDKAVGSYQECLKRTPADEAAKYNLELAKLKLKQQQQQQQQQNQDQQKDDKDKKDEQKDQQQQQDQDKKDQQQQDQQQQQNQDQQQQEQEQQPQQGREQQMSKDDAERLLNALLQNEQNALKDAKKVKVAARAKREKDW